LINECIFVTCRLVDKTAGNTVLKQTLIGKQGKDKVSLYVFLTGLDDRPRVRLDLIPSYKTFNCDLSSYFKPANSILFRWKINTQSVIGQEVLLFKSELLKSPKVDGSEGELDASLCVLPFDWNNIYCGFCTEFHLTVQICNFKNSPGTDAHE
jgi:hypothetical protein